MSGSKSIDLTQGRVSHHVLRMLGPFTLALLALLSAGIIDTIYLGRIGVEALAAIGYCAPLTFIGNSANIGLGAGTMSAVSRALGEGDVERSQRHGAAAILLALLVMSILVALGLMFMRPVLNAMGAEPEIRELAVSYMKWSLPGLVIISVASMSNNILRANGEAMLPSSIMMLGAVINIILDPFLIFGIGPFPRLEVEGAAIATFAGNVIAAFYGFFVVRYYRRAVTFAKMTAGSIGRAWGVIGQVGIPAAGTNIIVPVATALATTIISLRLGTLDVATFLVVSRAEILSVGLLYALSACIGAVTGQNGGAGLTDRVRDTFKFCYWLSFVWALFMAVIMFVFAEHVPKIFTNDPDVIEAAVPYFRIVPITIAGYGFVFVSAAGLNAIGRPLYGLTYTIIRSLILYVPLIYIGVEYWGLTGAFMGIAAANVISGLISIFWTMGRAPMTARKS